MAEISDSMTEQDQIPTEKEFDKSLDGAQKWAVSKGLNENDVNAVIKSVRKSNRK